MQKECMFGVVILHFSVIEQTIACINSVINGFEHTSIHIVVVDNCSPDCSGEILKTIYLNNDLVSIKSNTKNLGFANGMNVGIEFLKENFYIQYFILLNNDTEIIGTNWPDIINEKYMQYKFAVLGPDIVNLDRSLHCNPAKKQMNSPRDLKLLIKDKRKKIFKYRFYIEPTISIFKNLIKKIIKKIIKYKRNYIPQYIVECIDVQLQGSCLILSEQYFKYYEKLFDKTFLYFEEAILKYLCDKENLISLYSPEIQLLHKEGKATDTIVKDYRKKKLFYLQNSLESCESFLKWIREENK